MAAPQIAGIAALVYQMHPDWTPRQVINFIKDKSFSSLFKTDLTNDYTNVHSVHGGANLIAYVPMASQRKFSFQRATV